MAKRLFASYVLFVLVLLVVLELPLALDYRRSEQKALTLRVERDAVAMASISDEVLRARSEERARQAQAGLAELAELADAYERRTRARVLIVDSAGTAQVATDVAGAPPARGRDFSSRAEVAKALQGDVAAGARYSRTLGYRLLYVAVPASSGGEVHGAVRLTYPMSEVDERVYRYWGVLGAVAALVVLVAALTGLTLARWVQRPLERLRRAATLVGEGKLSVRAQVGPAPPEIRELAHDFNAMVARLSRLVDSQVQFVADASHQLRTPLTALRLRLEGIEANAGRDDSSVADDVDSALREVDRLSRLVEGLIALARADHDPSAHEVVDVRAVVGERLDSWRQLAAEEGIELLDETAGQLRACCAQAAFEQVLDNLIDNSLRASAPGGSIVVSARRGADDVVEVHVVDRGSGMTDDQLAHAFDRFWTDSGSGGTGLGLAIARQLVESHGGTLELRHSAGTPGIDAVIRLDTA